MEPLVLDDMKHLLHVRNALEYYARDYGRHLDPAYLVEIDQIRELVNDTLTKNIGSLVPAEDLKVLITELDALVEGKE